MALHYAGIEVELREVLLSAKPAQMLAVSSKGTVPVLVLPNHQVLDESWDIVLWATQLNDPDNWCGKVNAFVEPATRLVSETDVAFKPWLDKYKYADRFPQQAEVYYRQQCELFLAHLEARLRHSRWLLGDRLSIADIGVFPFIRQFAGVDAGWFAESPYRRVRAWLQTILGTALFERVMVKRQPWQSGDVPFSTGSASA